MSVPQQDDWAWAHREAEAPPPVIGFEKVTAILVVHNGENWLPSTLKALADLEDPPGRLIAIDADSTDDSPHILQEAMSSGVVARGTVMKGVLSSIQQAPASGFTKVVNDVVERLPYENGWIWLLHDDATPQRSCLTELMRVATTPTAISGPAIVIPKLLRPKLRRRPDQVQSLGEAISVSGARVVSVDLDDVDQQQDESSRVVGASTAGLLIRRDAWLSLGGLAPQLPSHRAGVELGWRANKAGLVVRTAPAAAIRHQQAGLTGLRESADADAVDPGVADRVAGMQVRVAHSHRPGMAALGARLVNRLAWAGSWIAKDAKQGRLHAAVLKAFKAESDRTHALTAATPKESARPLPKTLVPGPGWGLRHAFETRVGQPVEDWSDGTINLDSLTGDDETVVLPTVRRQNPLGFWMAIAMLAGTVLACRNLIGFGPLVSTGLAPAPANLASAWAAWLTPTGAHGGNAPWLFIMALGSTIMGGQPNWWAAFLVLGGCFLAAWSAYYFVGAFVRQGPTRAWLSLLWAVILPVTGASSDGSPGWVVLAIALPWLAGAFVRWVRDPRHGLVGLRVPATIALATTLAVCVTPSLWLFVVVAAIIVAAHQNDWRGLLIIAAGPVVVLAPWLLRLLASPGRLLTGVDPLLSRVTDQVIPWHVLAGQAGVGSAAPLVVGCVVFGGLWIIGLVGLIAVAAPVWRRWLLGAWVAALAIAVAASRMAVTIDGQQARAAVMPWLMLAAVIAIGAGSAGWESAVRHFKHGGRHDHGKQGHAPWRVIGSGFVALVAGVGALWWLWQGEATPLQRASGYVPDFVVATQTSPQATRTMVVQVVDGLTSVSLTDAKNPVWGVGEQCPLMVDPSSRSSVATMGAQFANGDASNDMADRLSALAIGNVVVIGADDAATQAMKGIPNLISGAVGGGTVWTVGGLPSRASLVENDIGTPVSDGIVPPGDTNRLLRLAEMRALPWHASLDGVELEPVDSVTFQVTADGGALRWWVPSTWWAFWWSLVALVGLLWAFWPATSSAEQASQAGPRRAVR
ncbi:MAG: glycosyltransferase [Propionibacteriaceae bacterium]|nr:glycosyltransferase [Propionibacteriaceae bacterium]